MNVILIRRSKDEHLNMRWEPFATSTPLKPMSNNAKIISVQQKQLLIDSNYPHFVDQHLKNCKSTNVLLKDSAVSKPLISKKTRKKKSSIYIDLTSSYEDDSSDGNKKRPIIELRPGKKSKSIVVSKNLSNGKININKETKNRQKSENDCINNDETNAVFDVEDLKLKNTQSFNSKSRTVNNTVKLDSKFKGTSLSSDEGNQIFDETRKAKNISKDSVLHLVNKKGTKNNTKNNDSLKRLNASYNADKKVLKETFITNSVIKKSVHKNSGYDFKSLNISQIRNSKYNKSCKSQKRKIKDNENTVNIVKKTRTTKFNDNLVNMPIGNSGSLLHIWEYKNNVSHQLFSDSKEQEWINILDLTSEEVDEKVKNIESSLMLKKKKLPYMSCDSSHPSISNSLNLKDFEHQLKRKKQNWKKCLMSENPSNKPLKNVNTKIKTKPERNFKAKSRYKSQDLEFQMHQKSEEFSIPSDKINEENLAKNDRKNLKIQRKPKIKTANAHDKFKKSATSNDLLNISRLSDKLKSCKVHNIISCAESNIDNNEISDLNKLLVPEEDKKAVNRKKPVFKLLNELSFKKNDMGCSVAQGWGINDFKCGIFKLKEKSQVSCKTLHSSSNLGGVLIKGNLRMKIGNKELNLKEGDMVFVPPLTEWLATNIDEKVINIMACDNPAFVMSSSQLGMNFIQDGGNEKTITPEQRDPKKSSNDLNFKGVMNMACWKWKWSWVFNGLILLSISGLIVVLEYDIIPFRSLGFHCKDPNLSYKFKGDTIPFGYLMAVSVKVPLIAIFLVEFLVINSAQTYLNIGKKKNLKQAWHWYGQFFLGLLILLFLIQLGKSLIAEPRPHFFDTCKPDKVNCTSGYISEYKCTNKNLPERDVRDSFRSFPSGHSALGVYVAIFMTWFFQSRIPHGDYLVVPWLQCLFLSWGLLCALTRITDRRHHWWDVLAGSIFGVIMAAFTVKIFCKNFHCHSTKTRKPDKNLNEMENNINHTWSRKLLSSTSSCSQPTDDRELREVK